MNLCFCDLSRCVSRDKAFSSGPRLSCLPLLGFSESLFSLCATHPLSRLMLRGPLVTTPAPPRISRASSFPWLMHVLCSLLFVLYPGEHVLCMCVHTHMATRHNGYCFVVFLRCRNPSTGFSVFPSGPWRDAWVRLWVWSQRSKLCSRCIRISSWMFSG